MNKLIKGAIAGAAGAALLLGGAGSFALWNGSAETPTGTIQSGTLALASNTSDAGGAWTNTPYGGSTPTTVSLSTFKAVPGDTLTFTKKLDVTAIGNNLKATLAVDPNTIAATDSDASRALKTALLAGMTVAIPTPLPTNFTAGGTANTFTVSGASAAQTVSVTVTLPFPRGTMGDNTTQTGSVNLSSLAFTLQQN